MSDFEKLIAAGMEPWRAKIIVDGMGPDAVRRVLSAIARANRGLARLGTVIALAAASKRLVMVGNIGARCALAARIVRGDLPSEEDFAAAIAMPYKVRRMGVM